MSGKKKSDDLGRTRSAFVRLLETERDVPFHAAALLAARTLRGITQADLAREVGLSRQQINKLERGEVKNPPGLTVHALAAALQIPADYLGRPPGHVPREVLHFRGKTHPPDKVVEQLRVRGEHFQRLVARLEETVVARPVRIVSYAASGPDDVEAAAAACRVEWGLRLDNPISNVIRLLENFGAFVGRFPLEDDSVDAFSWWSHRPLILFKQSESATRQRFSLAHELGHLVLHRGKKTGDPDTEREAHRFASAFLLPKAAFWREFPRSGSRIHWPGLIAMKERWGVSIQALLHRAADLELINAATYRSAYVRISQLGWRKQEPGEPEPEVPELVRNIILGIRARGTNEHSVAVDLGFNVEMLESAVGVPLQSAVLGLRPADDGGGDEARP